MVTTLAILGMLCWLVVVVWALGKSSQRRDNI